MVAISFKNILTTLYFTKNNEIKMNSQNAKNFVPMKTVWIGFRMTGYYLPKIYHTILSVGISGKTLPVY